MANLEDFHLTLRPWLQSVWNKRLEILDSVTEIAEFLPEGQTVSRLGSDEVYSLYQPGEDRKKHQDFEQFTEQCVAIGKSTGIEPSIASNASDWFHFKGKEWWGSESHRIYVHTKRPVNEHALPVVRLTLQALKQMDEFRSLKVAGPGMSADRKDTILVYMGSKAAVKLALAKMQTTEFTAHYESDTPAAVKQVIPGLGYAENPPTIGEAHHIFKESGNQSGHSFGSYLASAIFWALRSVPEGNNEMSAFLDCVIAAFEFIGVNPKKPHVLSRSGPEVKHLEILSNHKIDLARYLKRKQSGGSATVLNTDLSNVF
jgi:HopA1 effector protein family